MAPLILEFLIFGCLGTTMEIFFTSFLDLTKTLDWRLLGYSYPWVFPVYGSAAIVLNIFYPYLSRFKILVRGTIYVACLYAAEYASGFILRKILGACPWEASYRQSPLNVSGLVRLDFFPAWFLAGLLFERFYIFLKSYHGQSANS